MPSRKQLRSAISAFLFALTSVYAAPANPEPATPAVQSFPLRDTQSLVSAKAKLEPVEYKDRRAVRMSCASEGECLALVRNTQFGDGSIEADVAVRLTTPPGVRNPGFIGLMFRSREDAAHYELFYIRPGNANAPDQAMRNHSVQYVAVPKYDWEVLRRNWPWVYESHAELQLETWTHIRIDVAGRTAKLYVNGAANPALVVDGLKGEDLTGAIGIWGSPGQESYYSNLKITPAESQPVHNGGEASGTWDLNCNSDAGPLAFSFTLERREGKLSGSVSGAMGKELPVSGTWRNGYIELWFQGTAPYTKDVQATANLAGWIDGDSAKGRLTVPGHADGTWTATRKAK